MSKAKHNCTCNHENVSYCKTCKVCHCADCNQEWRVAGTYNPYYWGQTYYTNGLNTPVLTSGQLGNTIQYKTTPTALVEPTISTTTTCRHK